MYLEFFGFDRAPFQNAPDPVLFLSPSHKEALAAVTHGVESRAGFIEIVGHAGLGKATVLHSYLAGATKEHLRPVTILNPAVTFRKLLELIYQELDWQFPRVGKPLDLIDHFYKGLIEEYKRDCNMVVIIHEAQNMPAATLEQLRMLLNLDAYREKLLQIVLLGQPGLDKKFDKDELRQMEARKLRARLLPLTRTESVDYIRYRLSKATNLEDAVFSDAALGRIATACKGIPGEINIVCDNALTAACHYQEKPVSRRIVNEVIADLYGATAKNRRKWLLAGVPAGLILLAALAFSPFGISVLSTPPQPESQPPVSQDHSQSESRKPSYAHLPPSPDFNSGDASPVETVHGKVPGIDKVENLAEREKHKGIQENFEVPVAPTDNVNTQRPKPLSEAEKRLVSDDRYLEIRPPAGSPMDKQPMPEESYRGYKFESTSRKTEQIGTDHADLGEVIDEIIRKHTKR